MQPEKKRYIQRKSDTRVQISRNDENLFGIIGPFYRWYLSELKTRLEPGSGHFSRPCEGALQSLINTITVTHLWLALFAGCCLETQ